MSSFSDQVLTVTGLNKRFGGLVATNDVAIDLKRRETLALIGPNGAGKSTLIMQLTGELRPDSGSIRLEGAEISRLSVPQRVHLGIARTFQITTVVPSFTVQENVAMAVQARAGHSFRFWRPARTDPALNVPASSIVGRSGLGKFAGTLAVALSHGHLRQLEIAIALASRPKVLLLDEPLAGMSGGDAVSMIALLRQLKSDCSMLLIEHDMRAVFDLADRIAVLVGGRVIVVDTPEVIRMHPEVRKAYLGDADLRDV